MVLPDLQQALAANPVLLYFAAFLAGLLVFFLVRGVLRNLPLLVHLIIGILAGAGVYFLLKNWIF
jgi:hypothetical protein